MSNELDDLAQFNVHQMDLRNRTDSLAKSVFLLSGGALTLSIGVFLRKEALEVPTDLIPCLQSAWVSLFMSIAAYILVLSTMILRDYCFGERWRKQLNGINSDAVNSPGWVDIIMWVLGVLAIISFLYGLASLAWVACSLLTYAT